jgi:hypothetical protein
LLVWTCPYGADLHPHNMNQTVCSLYCASFCCWPILFRNFARTFCQEKPSCAVRPKDMYVTWKMDPMQGWHFIIIFVRCLVSFFALIDLSSTLLHTTNDNQLFSYVFICFFNNSSLFLWISNLILNLYTFHEHEKTHVNLLFHIHVGG